MSKIKIAIIGANGRMGKAIIRSLEKSSKSELVQAICEKRGPDVGKDSGEFAGIAKNGVLFSESMEMGIKNADVIIDFSHHEAIFEIIPLVLLHKKPLVIGTTGHSQKALTLIEEGSRDVPILHSPNMSIGVNLLFKLTEIAAKIIGEDSDIEIKDIHHRHKKDSPSGTANQLKKILLKTLGRNESDVKYGREGIVKEERPSKEIAIHSFRAGEVIGDHTVYFFSPNEQIEITHKAVDRSVFAVGSIRGAEYLFLKQPGLYNMFDVLGFN